MKTSKIVSFFFVGAAVVVLGVVAQQAVTEAPAGFTTPTLGENPGSQSISNGVAEPPGDTFALDQAQFERSMIQALDWARFSMPRRARNAIRMASRARRARLRRFGQDIGIEMGIL